MAYSSNRAYSTYKREAPNTYTCPDRSTLMEYKQMALAGSYDTSKPLSNTYSPRGVIGYNISRANRVQNQLYDTHKDYEELAKRFKRRVDPYRTKETLDLPIPHFAATDALINQIGIFLAPVLQGGAGSGKSVASGKGK